MTPTSSESTTVIDLTLVEVSATRLQVETTLKNLLARGLLITDRAVNGRPPRQSDGEQIYQNDWWSLTKAGRVAIGQLPRGDEPA